MGKTSLQFAFDCKTIAGELRLADVTKQATPRRRDKILADATKQFVWDVGEA